MKKNICLALSLVMLMGFSIPTYANTADSLVDSEIEVAIDSIVPDATEHLILNAERYDIEGELNDFYYGTPFYGYLYDEDTGDMELNKSIIYYPLIINNSVESILTIGKSENGTLFCTVAKDFSDELNSHLQDNFICVGNGIDTYFVEEKQNLAMNKSAQDFSEGIIVGEELLVPSITKAELETSQYDADDITAYKIGPNGGTLTNFPIVKQSTSNTCASACLLAVARYLHPSTFKSWSDEKIHKLQQSNVEVGLTMDQIIANIDYVLNDVGGDNFRIKKSGRLTASGIVKTLYEKQLPAFAGYANKDNNGHFVVLCGFSKSGSNYFSAEFMDPATGGYKYSTARDIDFTIVWGNVSYTWKETISIS